MFDEIYNAAKNYSTFEEFEKWFIDKYQLNDARKYQNYIDATKSDNPYMTVAAQFAYDKDDIRVKWMQKLYADVGKIAMGYALVGNHEKVNECKNICTVYDYIALGYALGGHHEKVEELRQYHFKYVNDIARGYALGRYHEKVDEYYTNHGASVDAIAAAYKINSNDTMIEKYNLIKQLDTYLKNRRQESDSSGKTIEYRYGSIFSFFQKSFTQKVNAVNALKQALNGEKVDLSEHLSTLRNGNLGQTLRELVKSGGVDHFLGKKVTTVSDFIQALQEKNASASYQPPTV